MKILKPNHPVELALCEIEDILTKYKLKLEIINHAFVFIDKDNTQYKLVDVEISSTSAQPSELPRVLDSERLMIEE